MSSRKPGYLLGILLLGVISSLPLGLLAYGIAISGRYYMGMPLAFLDELGRIHRDDDMISDVWRDRFVSFRYHGLVNGVTPWSLDLIDPRTHASTTFKGELRTTWGLQVLVVGPRLWVVGSNAAVELVDGSLQPSSMVHPHLPANEQQKFLFDGEPALLINSPPGFAMFTFDGTAWTRSYDLVLPDTVTIDGTSISLNKASEVACIAQGDRFHLFVDVEGRMLHHEGLRLRSIAAPTTVNGNLVEAPVSALYAENLAADVHGWSIVNKTPVHGNVVNHAYEACPNQIAMLIDGKPAAMVVDSSDSRAIVGHLYRYEDGNWTEFATQTFPFGTSTIRAAICQDEQTSLMLVIASTGLLHVYEASATGINVVPRSQAVEFHHFRAAHSLIEVIILVVLALLLGGVYGFGTTVLMWWYTRRDYGFGLQQVKLAGIGRRALARLIDLAFIMLSTVLLFWWLTRDLDWLTLMEAMNLKASHPVVYSAMRIIGILMLWLVVCEGLIVVAQAHWGLTVGKWCCGLRVLQTSLRPCGIARSLVRELVLWFDACGLLCWTPGITSIALTDHRQRLGDLIADTIVVIRQR